MNAQLSLKEMPRVSLPTTKARRIRYAIGNNVLLRVVSMFLWIWVIFNIGLVVWILLTSVKSSREVFNFFDLPTSVHWDNYVRAWTNYDFGPALLNTAVIAVVAAATAVALAAPAAFVLARSKLPHANALTSYIVLGISIPHQAVLVPYIVGNLAVSDFMTKYVTGGWDPRISVVIIYVVWSLPFTIFVMTGYFQSLPSELEEAASIDGARRLRTFFQVMLPLVRPGILTLFVLNFITAWNEVLLVLILVQDPAKRTVGSTLLNAYGALQQTADWGGLFAGAVIVMLPTLILFIWLGNRIVLGMSGGIGR